MRDAKRRGLRRARWVRAFVQEPLVQMTSCSRSAAFSEHPYVRGRAIVQRIVAQIPAFRGGTTFCNRRLKFLLRMVPCLTIVQRLAAQTSLRLQPLPLAQETQG